MKTPRFFAETIMVAIVFLIMLLAPFTIMSKGDNKSIVSQTPLKPTDGGDDDKTLSPYFFINSNNPDLDQLPLKSTSAEVSIAGVIADVKIKQVYMNNGKNPIEAIYVFPASTRAAVYDMRMTVGDRLLVAKIKERGQARADYEQAKTDGKSATLLEQERPNVFQMNVANIMPGDTLVVELRYTELLIPESGVYEFVYPTVVGPRYSNQSEATASVNDMWISNPYQHEGEKPMYDFDIKVNLAAGMPIKDIRCPSHEMSINYGTTNTAGLALKNSGQSEGNRDVIIQYRLAENNIESGLLLYQGKQGEENFFLTMIQPPARPTNEQITPREYIFIMDVSGSMYGYPIETSKKLLTNLIGNLRSTDKFNVMLFAGSASTLSDKSIFATKENLHKALDLIDKQSGGGGTELLPALKVALALEKAEGFSRSFVIATDGYVSVEKESFDLIRTNLGKANFFAFGIGSSVNRFLIEGIAHCGMGEPFIVTDPNTADAQAEKFRKYIQTPVLTDIKVTFEGFDAYDIDPVNVPDVLAERPIIVYGKYRGNPEGTIKITGNSGSDKFTASFKVADYQPNQSNSSLKYLWVRQKIRMLDDYNNAAPAEQLKEEITALGIKYNLLTAYTSFIAIDSVVRNASGKTTAVNQPLPLPQGVSDHAVGGNGYGGGAVTGSYQPGRSNNKKASGATNGLASEDVKDSEVSLSISDKGAEYTGGEKAMKKFITLNIIIPQEAQSLGITGTVQVKFIVEGNGGITNITVIKSLGHGCDEEAIRLVELMKGKWISAIQSGINVSDWVTIDIQF